MHKPSLILLTLPRQLKWLAVCAKSHGEAEEEEGGQGEEGEEEEKEEEEGEWRSAGLN